MTAENPWSPSRKAGPPDPVSDCAFCPRLVDCRKSIRADEPGWHNAPVPTFAAADVRLLVVGLAPGLRGANRTGRPFTGDFAGDLLYATLIEFGFADGDYRRAVQRWFAARSPARSPMRALRAAAKQADACRNQNLPSLSRGDD